jgi:hypothetical protein
MMCVLIARSMSRSPSSSFVSQSFLPHSTRSSPPQMSFTRMSSAPTRWKRLATSLGTVWSTRMAMPSPPRAVTIAAVSSIVSGRFFMPGLPGTLRPVQ